MPYKTNINNIISDFQSLTKNLDNFSEKIEIFIKALLTNNFINYHLITSRVKTKQSLLEKIGTKGHKYKNLWEITDLVGIRVITYFEDEVDQVADVISKEFKVDAKRSIDKRILEEDKFGYQSLHYVVELDQNRKILPEWKKYKDYIVEIQIRSILQHAWAEIEHDIGYKGIVSIPQHERRSVYRIAALLETSDKEFVRLRKSLINYEKKVPGLIKETPENVLINKVSLLSYINNSEKVNSLDSTIAQKAGKTLHESDELSLFINRLNYINIDSIKELDEKLMLFNKLLVQIAIEWLHEKNVKAFKGISIFYLPNAVLAESNNYHMIKYYFKKNTIGYDPEIETKKLIKLYKKFQAETILTKQ